MLSKCANPACARIFRYLHEGTIFQLAPTPELQHLAEAKNLVERFWLCDSCAKLLTVTWDGARAKIVPLPEKRQLSKAAAAGREGASNRRLPRRFR